MDDLRRIAQQYSTLALQIDAKNKSIYNDREQRKILELQIVDIMKTPEFATVRNFQHQGCNFKIDPPGTWKGSWHLSKYNLKTDIVSYWNSGQPVTADDCFKYIVTQQDRRDANTDWRVNWTNPTGH